MSLHLDQAYEQKFELLSGYLDNELTQQEAQKVALLIETDPEYLILFQEMAAMRQEIQSLSLQEQELQHLDRLFQEPVARTSRFLGWALLAVSSTLVIALIFYVIFTNPHLGLLEKLLVGGLGLGTLALLFSVLRQRWITAKTDKYQRVKI